MCAAGCAGPHPPHRFEKSGVARVGCIGVIGHAGWRRGRGSSAAAAHDHKLGPLHAVLSRPARGGSRSRQGGGRKREGEDDILSFLRTGARLCIAGRGALPGGASVPHFLCTLAFNQVVKNPVSNRLSCKSVDKCRCEVARSIRAHAGMHVPLHALAPALA
eukprot:364837-Chlamydomonas_euryale.AAC.13